MSGPPTTIVKPPYIPPCLPCLTTDDAHRLAEAARCELAMAESEADALAIYESVRVAGAATEAELALEIARKQRSVDAMAEEFKHAESIEVQRLHARDHDAAMEEQRLGGTWCNSSRTVEYR
jgi:hypothetical protein